MTFFNYYELGGPISEQDYVQLVGREAPTARQAVAFELLIDEMMYFCRSRLGLALARGRGIARIHSMVQKLDHIDDFNPQDLDRLIQVAQPVTLSHILDRLPSRCGECITEHHLQTPDRVWAFTHQKNNLISPVPDLPDSRAQI